MALIVQKFGGSSVKDRDRIFNVARIVANTHNAGNDVVVVVSAQGDSTDDLTLTTLLSTSSTAYSMQDYAEATTAEQGANDPNGPFNIAVAASNSATGAKVVWVNCPNMLNSQMNSAVSGGNAQLLTSAVNWMTGEENGVVIDSKSMSAETLTVPAKATMLLGLLFTIVVPLAFIVVGIAITLVRRRR